VEEAAERAKACEAAALAVDKRLTNSEGAGVSLHTSQFIYANSLGFCNGYAGSRHGMSVAVIGEDKGDAARLLVHQRPQCRRTGLRRNRRPHRRHPHGAPVERPQARYPHLPGAVRAPIATGLIGNFVAAVSGGSLYRKSSFLLDSLGTQVFAPLVTIREQPSFRAASAARPSTAKASPASSATSSGTACCRAISCRPTRRRSLACRPRQRGRQPQSDRHPGEHDLEGLLKQMGTGCWSPNCSATAPTWSRRLLARCRRLLVENGEIQYPVEEITIAATWPTCSRHRRHRRDIEKRGSKQVGSILIDKMTVAGN